MKTTLILADIPRKGGLAMSRIMIIVLLGGALLWSGCGIPPTQSTSTVHLAAVAPVSQNMVNRAFLGSSCSDSPQQISRQPGQANDILGGAEQILRSIPPSSGQTFEQCEMDDVTYSATIPFPEALPATIHQATLHLHIGTTMSAAGILSCALWLDPQTTASPVQHALRLPQMAHDTSASAGTMLDSTTHILAVDVTTLIQGWQHTSTDQHSVVISGPNPGDGTFPIVAKTVRISALVAL